MTGINIAGRKEKITVHFGQPKETSGLNTGASGCVKKLHAKKRGKLPKVVWRKETLQELLKKGE